jgi:hypothetical protein
MLWRKTVRNGTSPPRYMPNIIMRATQKNRMSQPVSISDVG